MYHLKQIPSEAQIKKYIRRIVFGKNVFCPECRSQKVAKYEDRYRCKRCRCKLSLVSHTWLKSMKLSYQKFWLLLWAWTNENPIKQTTKLTELSEDTVRRWYDLFRSHLPDNPVILEKIVQLDEAYFKKLAVMMAKQKGSRSVAYHIIPGSVGREHAWAFLQEFVKPRSKLHTDGAGIYRGINRWWPVRHKTDIHKRWEFELTSEIEGLFGNLRTFIRRMYHHTSQEKLPEYVREFCLRFSLPEMFENPNNYLQKTLSLVPFD